MQTTVQSAGVEIGERRSAAPRFKKIMQDYGYLVVALVAVVIVGNLLTPYLLTWRNVELLLVSSSTVAILAIGQFMVIVTGGIDLSVGSIAALAAVVAGLALNAGIPAAFAVALGLFAGLLVGCVNGVMIVFGGISAFIATLAMLSVVSGVAFLIQISGGVRIDDPTFVNLLNSSLGPIRMPILLVTVIFVASSLVMAYSRFGRELYAIGGNLEASRLSGLPVQRDRLLAYAISGGLAALAGLMIAAQLGEGSARLGQGYELAAIAAVVVGGASLFGGTGSPLTSVLGAIITATIVNIMNLIGVQSELQLVITGLVILVAVFFTSGRGPALIAAIARLPKLKAT